MAEQTQNRSPTELARQITQATPKPVGKKTTLTQRANVIETILIEQGYAVDAANNRIELLADIQRRTIAEINLLKHQQTDHASRFEIEALQHRLHQLDQAHQSLSTWTEQQLRQKSPSTWAATAVAMSTLITLAIVWRVTTPIAQPPQTRPTPQSQVTL
jgi:hypothetical protein